MPTTLRADVVTHLLTTVATTSVEVVYRTRPAGYTGLPAAYIGVRDEDIDHDSGLRRREMETSVVLVDRIPDNQEVLARLDTLVDEVVDALTAASFDTSNVLVEPSGVTDSGEENVGGVVYETVTISIRALAQEGRN